MPPFPPRRLRVATLNLWNASEPYEERMKLVHAEMARLTADVIGLQEALDSPAIGGSQAAALAAADGYHVVAANEGPRASGSMQNAILSRYPIVGHEVRALPHPDGDLLRCVLRADLASPEGLLHFFCTHLSYRSDESWKRVDQVQALDDFVREASRELPRIMVGDFNADPDSDEIRFLTGKATIARRSTFYQDAAAMADAAAPTWSTRNPFTGAYGEGNRRIDYVFVTHARPDKGGVIADCRLAFAEQGTAGIYPSDHFGVFAEIWIGRKS